MKNIKRFKSIRKKYEALCRSAHVRGSTYLNRRSNAYLFTLGLLILFIGLSEIAGAQDTKPGDVSFNDEEIEKAWCNLYRLIEGSFGGLIATVAGIGAIISSAFGAYRASISLLVTSVAAFILRALVSLWFGVPDCGAGGGGGGGAIPTDPDPGGPPT